MKARVQRFQQRLISELAEMKRGHAAEQARLQAQIDKLGQVLDNWPTKLDNALEALRECGVDVTVKD